MIEGDEVGKRAADVDGDGVAHLRITPVQKFNGSTVQTIASRLRHF
jgi:hypothetical protein